MPQVQQTPQIEFNFTAQFDGADYSPAHDKVRLTGQLERIFSLMRDGKWRTLEEISAVTEAPAASVSAQLRHLRKPRFGMNTVNKRNRGNRSKGLFEYQLKVNHNYKIQVS